MPVKLIIMAYQQLQHIADRIQLIQIPAGIRPHLHAFLAEPVYRPIVQQHAGIDQRTADQHQRSHPIQIPLLCLLYFAEHLIDRQQCGILPSGNSRFHKK
ncbi:hypothetical protein D3C72_2069390 [compost metagenome]